MKVTPFLTKGNLKLQTGTKVNPSPSEGKKSAVWSPESLESFDINLITILLPYGTYIATMNEFLDTCTYIRLFLAFTSCFFVD